MAETPGNEVPFPKSICPFVGTTLAWDNMIYHLEETLVAGGTSRASFVEAEMELFLPNLETSGLQHLQLKGDKLAWKSSLDSLKMENGRRLAGT